MIRKKEQERKRKRQVFFFFYLLTLFLLLCKFGSGQPVLSIAGIGTSFECGSLNMSGSSLVYAVLARQAIHFALAMASVTFAEVMLTIKQMSKRKRGRWKEENRLLNSIAHLRTTFGLASECGENFSSDDRSANDYGYVHCVIANHCGSDVW
jgi:hypothetical protein